MKDKYDEELKVGDTVVTLGYGRKGLHRGIIESFNGQQTRVRILVRGIDAHHENKYSRDRWDVIKVADAPPTTNTPIAPDIILPEIPE